MPPSEHLWQFLPIGFLLTVLVETPVLLIGLSREHSLRRRLFCGVWLTACSYPVVVLAFPFLIWEPFGRTAYLIVAETFAPLCECAVFSLAFHQSRTPRNVRIRDVAAIVAANLASFAVGLIATFAGWIE